MDKDATLVLNWFSDGSIHIRPTDYSCFIYNFV